MPITFPGRADGQPSEGAARGPGRLRRRLALAGSALSAGGTTRFIAVGLAGMLVDFLAFEGLQLLGIGTTPAQLASFTLAAVLTYLANARWTFAGTDFARGGEHVTRVVIVYLAAISLRSGVLGSLALIGVPVHAAILFAIGGAALVASLGSAFYAFPPAGPQVSTGLRWRVAAVAIVLYTVVLRLAFIGLIDLMPQEAYYWDYAQHLDIGYLDHPPMVAWLIWAGTRLFGETEFGVRAFAWAGWFVTAYFSFALAKQLFGRSVAYVTLALVAALPFYFATGTVITPDAPLTAFWAGALYFLERALRGGQRRAWWGVGLFIGLGMLSKYTIALLGPAGLLFMLVDRRSRAWFARPEPYVAGAIALAVFSPVIIWNVRNGFASFAFQTADRIAEPFAFSLPALIVGVAALLAPTGLVAVLVSPWLRGRPPAALTSQGAGDGAREADRGVARFTAIFTLVPLSVFVFFSLSHNVKLNWTGPLWLATLPALSAAILWAGGQAPGFVAGVRRRVREAWAPTLAICLAVYGLGFNYLAIGVPGLGYPLGLPAMPAGWGAFGREIADITGEVRDATGKEPVLAGLDDYKITSELAFYGSGEEGVRSEAVGRGVLGQPSLMYGYWYPPEPLKGRPVIMVGFSRNQLLNPFLAYRFGSLSEPMERVVVKDGEVVGRIHYRVGYDLK